MAALLLGTSCTAQGLDFRQDRRIRIVAPRDRSTVTLPVTVRWRVRDFRVTGPDGQDRRDAGYFGLYVDRPPQPPGRTQAWLVREDPVCRRTPGCPDEGYLAEADIFSTTHTAFTIHRLADFSRNGKRRDLHEVTIVLLNGRGERIGEGASRVQFEVRRSR